MCVTDCMRLHVIACVRMQSHAIACNRIRLCQRLSNFLKIHREREPGLKVCPKCFFNNCEQIYYIIIFFVFLKKEEMRSGTHFSQQMCFFQKSQSLPRLQNSFGLSYGPQTRLLERHRDKGSDYVKAMYANTPPQFDVARCKIGL